MHDYNEIAAIVGEDKITALREAGVKIADKPTKPITGLLGRWAKNKYGNDLLIISEHVQGDGDVWTAFRTSDSNDGAVMYECPLSDLTFPEETTRPQDVPVGEAWLVNVDDGVDSATNVCAVKRYDYIWATKVVGKHGEFEWADNEVTLIAPLVPARPVDSDRERTYWEQQAQIDSYEQGRTPETVTTEDEYAALPEGSIVAPKGAFPLCKGFDLSWGNGREEYSDKELAGMSRTVLRKGWGE